MTGALNLITKATLVHFLFTDLGFLYVQITLIFPELGRYPVESNCSVSHRKLMLQEGSMIIYFRNL
jgi:hypothetical protein